MPTDDERRHDEEASRIKVTDRRAFTREGARREPDAPAEAAEAHVVGGSAAPDPSRRPEGKSRAGAAERPPGRAATSEPAPARAPEPGSTAEAAHEAPSIDFVAFVQSLYVGALMALGEVENPYTRQFETNLDLARQNIDILVMLRDKTRGNLSPEEDGFMEQVVPQLQLLFAKKAG
jgi:hypothetical protein